MGQGRFVGPKTIEVTTPDAGTRALAGDVVVRNTGSRARIDPIPGLADASPMTHVEALELDRVPAHLVVIGGGYVGLEFAQALRRFGSRVTVLERNDVLLHREDRDVSEALRDLLDAEGIEVETSVRVESVEGRSGKSVRLHTTTRGGCKDTIEASDLLVAAGRLPNTDGMSLEAAGIERDARGFISVDERLRTTAAGVWAVGDCAGSPHFTHVAFDDFRVVRDNLSGLDRVTTGRLVPYCIFVDPELAHVGLSESEAASRKVPYQLAKIPVSSILRAETLSETRGFLKALVAVDSDRILGFTAFSPAAGEIMAVVQTAMIARLPYTALRDAILTHPTMAEGLGVLFRSVPARS
jgi:pyruvate/2-oxoglutarate dehydrogenase complex dihydrolipoamide dehydrogenase (E3) component